MTLKLNIPTFKLNNGRQIPAIGFGTWLGVNEKPETLDPSDPFSFDFDATDLPKMMDTLSYAIDIGYRHVDTAHLYRVEPEVGAMINQKIKEGVVKREELFVTTKVWQHFHRPQDVEVSARGSLRRLNLDYVDLLLMHWPMSISQEGVDEKIDYLETWRGFEAVLAKGLTKSIGVSNFNLEQITRLVENCKIIPAVNQIEINLNFAQVELVDYCKSKGIQVEAYSPLGTMVPSRSAPNSPEPKLNNPTMVAIAKKYNKTVTQIAFGYLYQRGLVIVPKTITKTRIVENAGIFDFKLDKEDLEAIAKFNNGYRTVRPTFYQKYTNYPFEKVEAEDEPVPRSLRIWKCGAKGNIE